MEAHHIMTMSAINKHKTLWNTIQSSINFLKISKFLFFFGDKGNSYLWNIQLTSLSLWSKEYSL